MGMFSAARQDLRSLSKAGEVMLRAEREQKGRMRVGDIYNEGE